MNARDPGAALPPAHEALTRSTEDRYRRWLIAYPRRWRRVNADAFVGTWLDAAQAEGRERPTGGEVVDLLVHGLAERVRPVLPSAEVHRKAARLALIIGTAVVLTALVLGELLPPHQPRPDFLPGVPHRMGALSTTGPVLYLPWLVAAAAAASGAARAARTLLTASSIIALALIPGSAAFDLNRPPLSFLLGLAWLAVLAATSPAEPASSHRLPIAAAMVLLTGWLLISGVPSVTGFGLPRDLANQRWFYDFPFYRGPAGIPLATTALAAVLVLPLAALLVLGRRPAWLPAVLMTLPALALFTLIGPDRAWVASVVGPIPTRAWPLITLLPVAALGVDRRQKGRATGTTAEKW